MPNWRQTLRNQRRFVRVFFWPTADMRGKDTSYVYSAQLSRSKPIGDKKCFVPRSSILRGACTKWLPEMHSVIFTSATMAVSHNFDHFDAAIGLSKGDFSHQSREPDSSFDFDENMAVVVPKDILSQTMSDICKFSKTFSMIFMLVWGGSVPTLFTNRRDMEQLYERLSPSCRARFIV